MPRKKPAPVVSVAPVKEAEKEAVQTQVAKIVEEPKRVEAAQTVQAPALDQVLEEVRQLVSDLRREHEAFLEHQEEQKELDAQHRIRFEVRQLDREIRALEKELIDVILKAPVITGEFIDLMRERDKLMRQYWTLVPLLDDLFEFAPLTCQLTFS